MALGTMVAVSTGHGSETMPVVPVVTKEAVGVGALVVVKGAAVVWEGWGGRLVECDGDVSAAGTFVVLVLMHVVSL